MKRFPTVTKRWLPAAKLLALLGIIVLAAFFRLHQIDTIPPGNRYDPAYYGVDALQILAGERPIFLPSNYGREVLFSYLVALYIALFGAVPNAMYVTSAVVGIATVPAVYLLAEELFRKEQCLLRRYGGLLAALAIALSYWHLNWSRFGVRAILVPLFAALTFFFLWRGLCTNSKGWFVASGISLGLGAYTYQAARLFPILVVFAFLYVIAARHKLNRNDIANLGIVSLVALLVFIPLGTYFVAHPGSFLQRVEQASVIGVDQDLVGNLQAIGKGFVDTLLSFSIRGDLEPTTNLPGRPSLNAFLSVLFVLGMLISLIRIKKPVYAFLLTWLVLLIIPAIFSQQGPVAKRAIGALPVVMILVAVGALVPLDRLRTRAMQENRGWARVVAVALSVVLLAGLAYTAMRTYWDYFITWATDPDQFTHFEVGPTALGQYAATLPPDELIYVSPVAPDHPAIVYNTQNRSGIGGYDGRACLVLPQEAQEDTTYLIVPGEDAGSLDLLQAAFPQGEIVAQGPLHYNQPYFLAFQVPSGSTVQTLPSHPLEITWGDSIRLLGHDVDADAYRPGDTIHLTLHFQALNTMDKDYTLFVHLLGPKHSETDNPLWGQYDSEPCQGSYPTSTWVPGEILRDQATVVVPAEAPAGDYQLKVGYYLLETMDRLPAIDVAGLPVSDDTALLTQVYVE
jgi:4-amino-4-deoxy-L-arabinose transferase-like glycosyltransferase